MKKLNEYFTKLIMYLGYLTGVTILLLAIACLMIEDGVKYVYARLKRFVS